MGSWEAGGHSWESEEVSRSGDGRGREMQKEQSGQRTLRRESLLNAHTDPRPRALRADVRHAAFWAVMEQSPVGRPWCGIADPGQVARRGLCEGQAGDAFSVPWAPPLCLAPTGGDTASPVTLDPLEAPSPFLHTPLPGTAAVGDPGCPEPAGRGGSVFDEPRGAEQTWECVGSLGKSTQTSPRTGGCPAPAATTCGRGWTRSPNITPERLTPLLGPRLLPPPQQLRALGGRRAAKLWTSLASLLSPGPHAEGSASVWP